MVVAFLAAGLALAACSGSVAAPPGGSPAGVTSMLSSDAATGPGPSSAPAAGSAAGPSTTTTSVATGPSGRWTAPTLPVPAGLSGTLYATVRGGPLLEVDLATGKVDAHAVPESVRRNAPRELAVLPEGVVVFQRYGPGAAFPFDSGVGRVIGEPMAFAALDVVVAGRMWQLGVTWYDGRGELVEHFDDLELDDWTYAVHGDRLVYSDTTLVDRWTETVSTLAEGSVIAVSRRTIALVACGYFEPCSLHVASWSGESRPVPLVGPMRQPRGELGVLSPDDRLLAVGELESVTEPSWVSVIDLETGALRRVFEADGFLSAQGFTADGRHVLVPERLSAGTVVFAAVDGSGAVRLEFGVELLAVAMGPPMQDLGTA